MDLKSLKTQAAVLKPVVQIGKNGLTKEVLAQIGKYLKKHKLMKVKLLKASFLERPKKELVQELADRTQSILVHHVGFVVVLYRER